MSFWNWISGIFHRRTKPAPTPIIAPVSEPESLAIYYGWPSLVNGSKSIDEAAAAFAKYQHVVLGAGIEMPDHGDHFNVIQLIARLRLTTKVYGYVDIGNPSMFSLNEIAIRLKNWSEMKAAGVLLDDFGFDYWNTATDMRQRQILAVKTCHALGITPIMNAWDPDDCFAKLPENPVPLQAGEIYLMESFDPNDTVKLQKCAALKQKEIRIFAITPKKNITITGSSFVSAFGHAHDEEYSADDNALDPPQA